MIKKLLETSVGSYSRVRFVHRDIKLVDKKTLTEILARECAPYNTKDKGGVLVYFSNEDYSRLKQDKNYEVKE